MERRQSQTDDGKRTALVVGGTGLVGRYCLRLVLERPKYRKVIVLARRGLEFEHEKMEVKLVDFSRLDLSASELIADDVYCCLGTTMKKAGSKEEFRKVDWLYPLQIARMVVAKGARRYAIVSSVGANFRSPFFYSRIKGETEEDLRKVGFEGLYIFRPSLLLGKRAEFRLGEEIAKGLSKIGAYLLIGFLRKYRPIAAKAVARVMIHIMEEGKPGTYVFESDEIKEIYDSLRKKE